jgi:23S rRNA pseudouridine1911/1915/1917 synthase
MKKAIDKGLVKINGKTGYTGDHISGGEILDLYRRDEDRKKPVINLELEVLYEDEHMAIINKPSGIVVSGNKKWTVKNALSGNLKVSKEMDALTHPEPIHRLDYATSGALLVGKTAQSVVALNNMFADRAIHKTYMAVTIGSMASKENIKTAIDGKPSETKFKVLRKLVSPKYGFLNLVELHPQTGRRHQLRKHMSEQGNPIFGDLEYGKEGLILKGKGLYLHASTLRFKHPVTDEIIEANVPLPKKFRKLFP